MANYTSSTVAGQPAQLSVKGIWDYLWMERRVILMVALFIWVWTLAYLLLFYKPKYVSEATVLIKDSAITSKYVSSDDYKTTTSNASSPVLNTKVFLGSGAIRDSLWNFLRQHYPDSLKQAGVKTYRDWLGTFGDGSHFLESKVIPGTDFIAISFTWTDPVVARDALKNALATFQEKSLASNREEYRTRYTYLKAKADELSNRLKGIRRQKSAFKRQHSSINIGSESEDWAKARVDIETQLNQVIAEQRGKQSEYQRYQHMLGMNSEQGLYATAVGQNTTLNTLQAQLYTLTEQYEMMKASLSENNPKLLKLHSQINQLQKDIHSETGRSGHSSGTAGSNHVVADVTRGNIIQRMAETQGDATRLSLQANSLKGYLASVNTRLSAMPAVEEGLTNIEQDETILSKSLDSLQSKELEAQIKETETVSNVFVEDSPEIPLKPKFPSGFQVIFIGMMAGVVAGVAAALLKQKVLLSGLNFGRSDFDVSVLAPKKRQEAPLGLEGSY